MWLCLSLCCRNSSEKCNCIYLPCVLFELNSFIRCSSFQFLFKDLCSPPLWSFPNELVIVHDKCQCSTCQRVWDVCTQAELTFFNNAWDSGCHSYGAIVIRQETSFIAPKWSTQSVLTQERWMSEVCAEIRRETFFPPQITCFSTLIALDNTAVLAANNKFPLWDNIELKPWRQVQTDLCCTRFDNSVQFLTQPFFHRCFWRGAFWGF